MQNHHRSIWSHRGGDDIRLHASKLNTDARGEVIRAFFSTAYIPTIPCGALPIYSLGARETSLVIVGILKFNALGPFLSDGVTPGPPPSALAASSEQDSAVREAGPEASEDPDDDDVDSSERVTRRGRSQSTVVLMDSTNNDEAASAYQPAGGDATASSSRDLKEEEHQARLEAERRSKFIAEHASRRPEMEPPTARGWPARPRHPCRQPQPFLAREVGSSATPREYHLQQILLLTYVVTQHTTACCSIQVIDITLMKYQFTNITSLRVVQQKHSGLYSSTEYYKP
jgi:hypothetical protein